MVKLLIWTTLFILTGEESNMSAATDVTMVTIDALGTPDTIEDATEDETEEVDVCRRVVELIRKDEFGIGVLLSEDGQRLMKVG